MVEDASQQKPGLLYFEYRWRKNCKNDSHITHNTTQMFLAPITFKEASNPEVKGRILVTTGFKI